MIRRYLQNEEIGVDALIFGFEMLAARYESVNGGFLELG